MGMHRIFRAKAKGGITPREADRREGAVRAAAELPCAVAKFPAPMPQFGGPAQDHEPVAPISAAPVEGAIAETPAPWRAEPPVIRIEIAAPKGAGKSAIAHVLRTALSLEGLAFEGPRNLPSMDVRWALRGLRERGIRVEITETEITA